MTVGDGIILWFFVLALIALLMLRRWMKKGEGKRLGATLYDLGAATAEKPTRLPWAVIGKSALISLILFGWLYGCAALFEKLWHVDFRYVWPLFRPFDNAIRLGQFLLYLPFYLFFFVVGGGVKLFGQLRLKRIPNPFREQLVWWLKSVLVMLGGLFIIALIEYVPFFLGAGPGNEHPLYLDVRRADDLVPDRDHPAVHHPVLPGNLLLPQNGADLYRVLPAVAAGLLGGHGRIEFLLGRTLIPINQRRSFPCRMS